MSAFS